MSGLLALHLAALCALLGGLAALFWIDLKTGYLPDIIVFPLSLIGLALAFLQPFPPLTWIDCLLGGALGLGLMALFRWITGRMLGRETMGLGDVKFMGMAGLWVGWQGLNAILVGGAVLSFLIALVRYRVHHKTWRGFQRGLEIPLGPGLCLMTAAIAILDVAGVHIGPSFMPME